MRGKIHGFNYASLTWWSGVRYRLWPLFGWWWPGVLIFWTDKSSEEESRANFKGENILRL